MRYLVEPLPPCEGNRKQAELQASRRLLKQLVGDDRVEHNAAGAPYLPARTDLWISISHCRRAVAVAVNEAGPVGIDIECRRTMSDDLARRICSTAEAESVAAAADPPMQLLQIWTRKEASLKCRGTGIQGFDSLMAATTDGTCRCTDIATGIDDVVGAVAVMAERGEKLTRY